MVQSHGTPASISPPSSWSKSVRRFVPVTIAYVPKKPRVPSCSIPAGPEADHWLY